jgi:hypothetical protein
MKTHMTTGQADTREARSLRSYLGEMVMYP